MHLPESKPDSLFRIVPKGASGRHVRHFVRRTASRLCVLFTTKHNAFSTSYLPPTNASRLANGQAWSPTQSTCTSPDSFWSYYSRSELSRKSSSMDNVASTPVASTRPQSPVAQLQPLQVNPVASASEEHDVSARHGSVTDCVDGQCTYPGESVQSRYQVSQSSQPCSCCSRSSSIQAGITTHEQQVPHVHPSTGKCDRMHLPSKDFDPDLRQLTHNLHLFRAHGNLLLHHVIYHKDAYPDDLHVELNKLIGLFDSIGSATYRTAFHLTYWGAEKKSDLDNFLKKNPYTPYRPLGHASGCCRHYPYSAATSMVTHKLKHRARAAKSKLYVTRRQAEWNVLESMRAASNTAQLTLWGVLPMAVSKRCMLRHRKHAENNNERMEID